MSLFIGGLHDGELHRVELDLKGKFPAQWSMSKRQSMSVLYQPYMHPAGGDIDYCSRTDHYKLLEFHLDGRDYHIYRQYKLTPNEAFEMLLHGYQHIDIE